MRLLVHSLEALGHLRPLVPIAQAARSAGHDVAVAATQGAHAEVSGFGLDFIPLPDPPAPEGLAFRRDLEQLPVERRIEAVISRFLGMAVFWAHPLADVVAAWRPDVILRDSSAWAGLFAGELTDVPVAMFDFGGRPGRVDFFATAFAQSRSAVGLPEDPEFASIHRWLTLIGAPPEWLAGRPVPPTAHLIQPPEPEPTPGESVDELLSGLDGRPLVYATLGSTFNSEPGVWPMVLDGLARVDANIVATVGRDLDPAALAPEATNIRLVRFVPQAMLLPHCSAVLAHGGYGSLMGALRHGVPIVSLPLAATDNRRNAANLERLGAGIAIHEESRSAESVASAMANLLRDQRYAAAAGRLRDSIASLPDAAAAVALLHRLARERQPIPTEGHDRS